MNVARVFLAPLSFLLLTTLSVRAASNRSFTLPPQAREIAPGVFDLGQTVENGERVQGLAILHPKPKTGETHRPGHNKGGGTTCYAYISNGARWRTTEHYLLDPANSDGYPNASVSSDIATGMQGWEDQANFNIFGNNLGPNGIDGVDTTSTDGKNELFFGDIQKPDVIAATTVWYTIGPPQTRRIVEHDMIFEDPDYAWGNAGPTSETTLGNTNLMDFLNIAVHELGHSSGMADVYDTACTEETEYGYSTEGETKKRTLNTADIEGIMKLYK